MQTDVEGCTLQLHMSAQESPWQLTQQNEGETMNAWMMPVVLVLLFAAVPALGIQFVLGVRRALHRMRPMSALKEAEPVSAKLTA
jgi:hypothetical protein